MGIVHQTTIKEPDTGKGMSYIKYIADDNHYKEVLSLIEKAKRTVWIGTADI